MPVLYDWHRGSYKVANCGKGNHETLNSDQIATVDSVLAFYGDKSSQWLSDLTHSEDPWRDARKGLAPSERGNHEITHASMAEYYSRIASEQR